MDEDDYEILDDDGAGTGFDAYNDADDESDDGDGGFVRFKGVGASGAGDGDHGDGDHGDGDGEAAAAGAGGFNWDGFDQVKDLQDMNELLMMKLAQEEQRVKTMRSELAAYQMIGKDVSGDLREKKLVEVVKKNRALTVSLEKERTTNGKLLTEIKRLRAALNNGTAVPAEELSPQPARRAGLAQQSPDGPDPVEKMREWKEKYMHASSKLQELRVVCEQAKADLAKTTRALVKEVGDDMPLTKVLDESSGWKGRAQQLTVLKAKVRDLTKKLSAAGAGGAAPAELATPQTTQRQRNMRIEVEALTADLEKRTEDLAAAKRRGDGYQARIKTLENNVKELRGKIQSLVEKTKTDDKLINALRTELGKQKQQTKQAKEAAEPKKPVISEESLKRRILEQEGQIDRQEAIIHALRTEIQHGTGPANVRLCHILDDNTIVENKLAVENAKLREHAGALQRQLERAASSVSEVGQALAAEQSKNRALEEKLVASMRAAEVQPKKRPTSARSVQSARSATSSRAGTAGAKKKS